MHTQENLDELLTPAKAAALLGISPKTLRQKATIGLIRCYRPFGTCRRYRRGDVLQIRDGCAEQGAPRIAVFPNSPLDRFGTVITKENRDRGDGKDIRGRFAPGNKANRRS
jgi:hypothetical protein